MLNYSIFISIIAIIVSIGGCKKTELQPHPEESFEGRIVAIPDPIFEKYLAAFDSDSTINGQILYEDIKDIESLYISAGTTNPFGGARDTSMSASSLSGIEHFTNLKFLTVETSKISVLDLIQNKNLEYVDCSGYYKSQIYYRGLKELKIFASDKLKTLVCNYTLLEDLEVEGFSNLERLSFMNSEKLRDVKVNKNLNLISLSGNMQASAMDLSRNEKLQHLTGMVQINQQTLKNKPELSLVDVTTRDNVEELSFCENPKIKNLRVTSSKLSRLTIPTGITESGLSIHSSKDIAVSRCK